MIPPTDTGDTGPVPLPTPTPTGDTGTPPVDLGAWDHVLHAGAQPGMRGTVDVAILGTAPLRIVRASAGFYDGNDYIAPPTATAWTWNLATGDLEDSQSFWSSEEYFEVPNAQVEAVGDVTGDGLDDLVAHVGGLIVGPGPLDLDSYAVIPETFWVVGEDVVGPGFRSDPCDVDADGQPDLCNSRGIDLGPVDGSPELFWDPEVVPYGEALAIGQLDGEAVAFVRVPDGIVRIPVASLLTTPGEVDLSSHPTSPAQTVSRLTAIDPDGDGTSDLVSCAGIAGSFGVWLHTDFPSTPTLLLALTGDCTDIEPGDFDGDGQLEVAVGYASRITIVELDGTERFTHIGAYDPTADGLGIGIDSADIDGDGRDDLLTCADRSRSLYLTLDAIPAQP